ncbi:hypothetical protein WSM22_25310 [Cytophagales bacterium WSM2-2]|nr:hypothetical protein WSM22_25310 [Cytophagales bacterium WSM2-2]
MNPSKIYARIAGLIYLIIVAGGIFNLKYIPETFFGDDPIATANNFKDHELLFRVGILVGIICFIGFLLLPLALYRLLSPVNKTQAVMMVTLAAVSVPISFVNMLNEFAILTWLGNASYLKAFSNEEIQAQVLLHIDYYRNGNKLAFIFWGLWLFPFGYLVFKSGFLPKVLGVLLMFGCFGYVIDFAARFIFPGYKDLLISEYIRIPGSLGELGICLWLLIVGVTTPKAEI